MGVPNLTKRKLTAEEEAKRVIILLCPNEHYVGILVDGRSYLIRKTLQQQRSVLPEFR